MGRKRTNYKELTFTAYYIKHKIVGLELDFEGSEENGGEDVSTILDTLKKHVEDSFELKPKIVYYISFDGSLTQKGFEGDFKCNPLIYSPIVHIKKHANYEYGKPYTPALFAWVSERIESRDNKGGDNKSEEEGEEDESLA